MDNIVFIVFRRMRQPLLTLLGVYTISILGLVLIPGQDATGNSNHLSIFHAIYFTSYMATTIGFGEIPYEFTDAQRLWVTFMLYSGVIAWLYAIGTILSLLQDKTFQESLAEFKLARRIRQFRQPFYLICGYGETGSKLVKGLTDVGQHVVVVEVNEQRANLLSIANLRDNVPILYGDARSPLHLQNAGLKHSQCRAVVAVTDDNETNLKIAITSKLLHPDIKVICRADAIEVEKNMASFGTDFIIDPYDAFANSLATAFQVPCLYFLQNWLYSNEVSQALAEPIYPPTEKHWVICGFGRFGKAVYERLVKENINVTVIEADPESTGRPEQGFIQGTGTEAKTLLEADIISASGLIAGTDNDVNNLSIIVTALELNPRLFTIIRQNHTDNSDIIHAVKANIVMHPSKIIADKIRILLGTPMLYEFTTRAFYLENEWACELVSRLYAIAANQLPEIEEITISSKYAPAVNKAIQEGELILLGDILRDPWNREKTLKCIVLMVNSSGESLLLPDENFPIKRHDKLLVCASHAGLTRFYWNLQQDNLLHYSITGEVTNTSWLWNKLFNKGS